MQNLCRCKAKHHTLHTLVCLSECVVFLCCSLFFFWMNVRPFVFLAFLCCSFFSLPLFSGERACVSPTQPYTAQQNECAASSGALDRGRCGAEQHSAGCGVCWRALVLDARAVCRVSHACHALSITKTANRYSLFFHHLFFFFCFFFFFFLFVWNMFYLSICRFI
jgi:hypothetical protein